VTSTPPSIISLDFSRSGALKRPTRSAPGAAPLKLGGIAGKAAALSDDALSAGAKGLTNAGAAAQRGVDAANHWLGEAASSLAPAGRPALAPAGAGSDVGTGMLESRGIRQASQEASSTRAEATATDRRNVVDNDVAGGHTVSRHVQKSKASLQDRLDSDPKLKATSSFPNLATANFAQTTLVKQNRSTIDHWLKSSETRPLKVEADTGKQVGRVLERNGRFAEATKVRGISEKDTSPQGWHFRTSFPIK